jgi:hypothetical protein
LVSPGVLIENAVVESSAVRLGVFHSEPQANLLMDNATNFDEFSEWTLSDNGN